MPTGFLTRLIPQKPQDVRLLGLDIGRRTIGLALSNTGQTIATPLKTINRQKFTKDIQSLKEVIHDYGIGGYVLGWPVNMDGSAGPQCDMVRSFADEMTRHSDIFGNDPWVAFWDERLSTVSVEDSVGEFVDKKTAKATGLTDKLAAHIILQSALDHMRLSDISA